MRELGPADAGCDLAVSAGESFVVRLPENASTGFQWAIVERPAGLECAVDRPVPAPGAMAGAAGLHEFEFTASQDRAAQPQGRLVLHLRRSWEAAREPAETFVVTVVVAP